MDVNEKNLEITASCIDEANPANVSAGSSNKNEIAWAEGSIYDRLRKFVKEIQSAGTNEEKINELIFTLGREIEVSFFV